MSLLIRPATAAEAPQLQGLVRSVPDAALPRVDEGYVERTPVFSGWEGSRLAGFYALEPRRERWWLAHLWVAEPFARRGRGRWLLTDAVRRARALGAASLCFAPEPGAERFFRNMGAQAAGGDPRRMEIDIGSWLEPMPESVFEIA